MTRNLIKNCVAQLEKENYKSFYLAFLRVAISCWLLIEAAINSKEMGSLYEKMDMALYNASWIKLLTGDISIIKSNYHLFVGLYVIVIAFNILGVGRRVTAFLLFFLVLIMQKMNVLIMTGGDLMARLALFYLAFANSYQYFVLVKDSYTDTGALRFKNILSNLAALSIMFQLCLAYFGFGVSKIMDPLWRHGEGLYYVLSQERFTGTSFNKNILFYKWIDIVTNYAVIIFELIFPLLIWIKKLRKPLLLIGILFHLSIFIFLMIYGFQVVFILIYGIFLPNRELVNFAGKLRVSIFHRGASINTANPKSPAE